MPNKKYRVSDSVFPKMKNQVDNDVIEMMSANIATRQTSLDYFTLFQDLPNPDPILKALGNDIEVYEQLRYDSRASAVIQSRKSAVLSQKWEVTGPRAAFYTEIFDTYKMHDVIGQILDAVLYGYQIHEIIWNKVGEHLWPTEFVGKPQR